MSDVNSTEINAAGYMRLAMANTADAMRLQGFISAEHCSRIKNAIWSEDSDAVLEAFPCILDKQF